MIRRALPWPALTEMVSVLWCVWRPSQSSRPSTRSICRRGEPSGAMKSTHDCARTAQRGLLTALVLCAAVGFAAPAHADLDTDFADQLHGYAIYGPRDYNAWLGKVTCERLHDGLDDSAYKSAQFLSNNLPRGSTTAQAWQFLAVAINTYCPDQEPMLTPAAGPTDAVAPNLPGQAVALR
jgi:hypothetical protein